MINPYACAQHAHLLHFLALYLCPVSLWSLQKLHHCDFPGLPLFLDEGGSGRGHLVSSSTLPPVSSCFFTRADSVLFLRLFLHVFCK